jgi:hypothetical protein|eukprot:SAG25_NODE_775_length_5417_cov_5.721700_4_plen_98_part_00
MSVDQLARRPSQGLFGVKFFINGAWQTVLVDDRFPCVLDGSTGHWVPLFASSADDAVRQVGPMLLEKAWCAGKKCYLMIRVTEITLHFYCFYLLQLT